jgi:hypothetical protein
MCRILSDLSLSALIQTKRPLVILTTRSFVCFNLSLVSFIHVKQMIILGLVLFNHFNLVVIADLNLSNAVLVVLYGIFKLWRSHSSSLT